MPHIVGEEVTVEPVTVYDSTAYGYCLSKHPALKKLSIFAYDNYSVEVHRLLEPVCASGTLQTLRLFLGEVYSFLNLLYTTYLVLVRLQYLTDH